MTVSDLDPAYLGPDAALLDTQEKAWASPVIAALSEEEQDALRDRIIGVRSLEDLPADDQALLARACAVVDAGGSDTWQHHAGGDWAAEDAALDAVDETKALDDDEEWVGL